MGVGVAIVIAASMMPSSKLAVADWSNWLLLLVMLVWLMLLLFNVQFATRCDGFKAVEFVAFNAIITTHILIAISVVVLIV